MVAGFILICSKTCVGVNKSSFIFKEVKLTLISRNKRKIKMFHTLYVPLKTMHIKVKGKGISVTGRGGPEGCERCRFPHLKDSTLTDGGEGVSLTRRPPFTPHPPGSFLVLISVSG
jgi:hypothetical protein